MDPEQLHMRGCSRSGEVSSSWGGDEERGRKGGGLGKDRDLSLGDETMLFYLTNTIRMQEGEFQKTPHWVKLRATLPHRGTQEIREKKRGCKKKSRSQERGKSSEGEE